MTPDPNPLNIIRVRPRETCEAVLLTEENIEAVAKHYGLRVETTDDRRRLCSDGGTCFFRKIPVGVYLLRRRDFFDAWGATDFDEAYEPIPAPAPDLLGEAREIDGWAMANPGEYKKHRHAAGLAGSLLFEAENLSQQIKDCHQQWADALARARAWKAGQGKENKQ
jgi:hypothetical protein